jgi:hypothetical protein
MTHDPYKSSPPAAASVESDAGAIAVRRRPTTKFWSVKTHREQVQSKDLVVKNPAMLAILCYASWYCWERWMKKIRITSIFRPDDTVHGDWRGTDLRIYNRMRDGEDALLVELTSDQARELVAMLNRVFDYGRTWLGRKTVVAHYRTGAESGSVKSAPHIHLQTKRRMWR